MRETKPFVSFRVHQLSGRDITRTSGALLLSDISGFTAISEALGGEGKEGTEELSYLLNDYFNGMLKIIRAHGGEVIKFCGDSLLIAFYDNPSEDAVRACARGMMEETKEFEDMETCAGIFNISMRVVGRSGEWNELVLGDNKRREHFLCGKRIREIMSMENRALSGEIVIEWERETRCKVQGARCKVKGTTDPGWERSFLPQGVADLAGSKSAGEHRAVSVVFVNFYGYDEEKPQIEPLQELFRQVISITEKYGGVIHDIDSHTRGSNIMILFGAPVSHENDAERAVTASMELSKLKIEPLRTRVGVCTGFVYAGVIGSEWRKEYAVIGDTVNTAERLMETARAKRTIVSGSTCSLTMDRIEYRELKSARVKGKEELLKRFAPLEAKEEKHFRFDFVGREEETRAILDAIAQGGKAIIIKGAAGIGKSRLLHEVKDRFFGADPAWGGSTRVLEGYIDEMKGPLNLFASMIGREAGIRVDESENVRKEKLEKHVREIAATNHEDFANYKRNELYKRIPFLGAMLFGIKYPGSLYEKVSTNLRFENLCDAIRYYIEYQTRGRDESRKTRDESTKRDESTEKDEKRRTKDDTGILTDKRLTKVVVMLDNFQWLGKDALRIVGYVTRALLTLSEAKNEITFLLSGRPEPDVLARLTGKRPVLPAEVDVLEFDLSPLTEESTASLSSSILKNKPLSEEVAEIVFKRTEGNPFYLEQFLLDLIEKGLIREVGERWAKTVKFREEEIPENIFSAIISRVDRLEEKAKGALKVGSVVGMEFSERMVQKVIGDQNVSRSLAQTEKENLIYRKAVKEIEYIFMHAMIKDVIYDSILRKQRRELHRLVGEGIESLHRRERERFYGVLAHHFTEAGEWEKALDYSLKAGKQAAKDYHNEAAIQHFSRTAEIAEEEQPAGADLRVCLYDAYKALAEIHNSVSSYQIARGYYQNAIAVAGVIDKKKLADALNGIATTYSRQADYDEALKAAREAYAISREIRYKKGIAASLYSIGAICWFQGRNEDALKYYMDSLEIEREIENEIGIAMSLNAIGVIHGERGQTERALKYYLESISIKMEIEDKRNMAVSLHNMGTVYSEQGLTKKALEYYTQALEIATEIGDKRIAARARYNEGIVYDEEGHDDDALRCYTSALKIEREIGDKDAIVGSLNSVGTVYGKWGQYEEASKRFTEALGIGREIGNRKGLASVLDNMGLVHYYQGRYEEALECYKESLGVKREIGNLGGVAGILSSMTDTYISLGLFSRAVRNADEALRISAEIGTRLDVAQILPSLIRAYAEAGNLKKAEECVSKVTEMGKGAIGETAVAPIKLSMSRFYECRSNLPVAITHAEEALEKAKELKDVGSQAESYLRLCETWGARQERTKEHRLVSDSERSHRTRVGEACATEACATEAPSTDQKLEAYATEALTIGKKLESLALLWKSHYWLYRATEQKRHLNNAKKYLKEQFKHVPAKYLKDFKRYVRKYTREELDITEKAS